MIRFGKKQDPLTQEEFDEMFEDHKAFINSGGAGGGWNIWVTNPDDKKGVVFGQYLGPEGISNEGKRIKLSYNNLGEINLEGISLIYADIVGVYCKSLNFKNIDLTGSLCIDSDFRGSNFKGANLTKVDFSRSKMQNCNFKNANLSGTDFENVDLTGADLTGAIVTAETSFKGTIIKDALMDFKKVKNSIKLPLKPVSKKIKPFTYDYKNCTICETIPDKSYAFWKGGDLQSSTLPDSEAKLEIIGAPIYDASTSHSHSIIKRCPACGTCYKWDFEYEYLVNGSEDEINLTRLSQKNGEEEVKKVIQDVRMQNAQLRAEGVAKALRLDENPGDKEFKDVADFFRYNQLVKGFDISYVIKYLVNVLVNHTHLNKNCVGNILYYILLDHAEKKEKNNEKILNLLLSDKLTTTTYKPEAVELIKNCKLKCLNRLTKKVKILEEELKSEKLGMADYKRLNDEIEELSKRIKDLN